MNKTIAIIYDKALKPETEVPAKDAAEYFRNKDCKVLVNPRAFNIKINTVIVYGGDGLLLHVSNQIASCEIPIIGVNYGRKGYLCRIKRNENYPLFWDKIISEDYYVEYRTRISAEITTDGITEFIDALNEISIGGIDKTVYLRLFINPQFLKEIAIESIGDGIIFSTKTGSTAYNVNAGGSVLLTDVFSIVANNCLFQSDKLPMNTKSLITNTDTQFEVEITNKNKNNLPYIVADGQRRIKLTGNEKVVIRKSPYTTKFIGV